MIRSWSERMISPSVADHPLRPATDHRLGRPLPHQLANPTRAPLGAINLCPVSRDHAVLAEVSLGYPPLQGRFPRATHPCATPVRAEAPTSVRLACVKHAASVRSEPGSNSHVHSVPEHHNQSLSAPAKRPSLLGPLSTQRLSATRPERRMASCFNASKQQLPSPPPAHP